MTVLILKLVVQITTDSRAMLRNLALQDIPECPGNNITLIYLMTINVVTGVVEGIGHSYFTYLFIALDLLLGLGCVLFNSIIYQFYKKKSGKEILPLLYSALSLCDLGTGVSSILHSVTLLFIMVDLRKALEFLLIVTYVLTTLFLHVSATFNVILVVTRTMTITQPFYRIKRVPIILTLVLITVFWFLLIILDIYFGATNPLPSNFPSFDMQIFFMVLCPYTGISIIKKVQPCSSPLLDLLIVIGLPFVLPTLISLVCVITQAYALLRNIGKHSKRSRRITVTIIILTVVFFVCNSTFFITIFIYQTTPYTGKDTSIYVLAGYLLYSGSTLLPFINALLNPITLICRGKIH